MIFIQCGITNETRDLLEMDIINTPGTAGGLGGRDQTLAVKSKKSLENQFFFRKKIKMA